MAFFSTFFWKRSSARNVRRVKRSYEFFQKIVTHRLHSEESLGIKKQRKWPTIYVGTGDSVIGKGSRRSESPLSLIFTTSRKRRKMLRCIVFGSKREVDSRLNAFLARLSVRRPCSVLLILLTENRARRRQSWTTPSLPSWQVHPSALQTIASVVIALQAHTSHALQPHEVGVFSALKELFKQVSWRAYYIYKRDMRSDVFAMAEIAIKAYDDTFCIRNNKGGFLGFGVWPLSPSIVLERHNCHEENFTSTANAPLPVSRTSSDGTQSFSNSSEEILASSLLML